MKLVVILLYILSFFFANNLIAQQNARPNIVIILTDDLGFSDIGCFGSEISTPNLDKLAKKGVTMTNFYNCARCCPSRASLLTGLYPHQAGVGDMTDNKGYPPYQGYLNSNCITIAQALKQAGYYTITSGKWHVGMDSSAWACKRGFDKSFTMMNNGSSYYTNEPLYNDGKTITFMKDCKEIKREDTTYYLTKYITDFAVKAIEEQKSSGKPFFLYVTYTAPHWPLQAMQEDIKKYKGKYRKGWDAIREKRYKKQIANGIIKPTWKLSARYEKVLNWQSLSETEKENWDARMAIYAAMVDRMDKGVGEIVEALKKTGKEENTIILFLSDNGGSADEVQKLKTVIKKNGQPGSAASIDSYDPSWGNVSNTPFRLFKKNMHEGGISTPFIAYYPGFAKAGTINNSTAHIIDIMPTCLELAGAKYPVYYNENKLTPLEGISLAGIIKSGAGIGNDTLYWEHEGNKAIRAGKWKLVYEAEYGNWELYDMEKDRTETTNLSASYPALVTKLLNAYQKWEKKVGVVDWAKIK